MRPLQWDLAVQLALNVASEGQAEPNVDPIERMRIEEITRIAELQVGDVTGMPTTPSGRSVSVVAAPPAEWARRSLESWRPLIEEYAAAIRPPAREEPPDEAGDESGAGFAALLEKWAAAMAPAMIALQVGSIIGHLARRTLGQYELPLPRMPGDEITVVPSNVAAFASDWSLELDDVTMWLAAHDLAAHAVLSRPHVHDRLQALLVAHAAASSRTFRRSRSGSARRRSATPATSATSGASSAIPRRSPSRPTRPSCAGSEPSSRR